MSTIRVTCLLCDQAVEVPASEVVLHLTTAVPDTVDRYGFTCPGCAVYVVRRANQAVVDALLHTDDVEVAAGPLPPWERSERPDVMLVDAGQASEQVATATSAAPITEADVLLLRKALDDDAILAAWLAG